MNHLTKCSAVSLALLLQFTVAASAQQPTARNPRVPATVRGYQMAELYAKVDGYLASISVDIGDVVKQGQVLAKIDVPEMEKQLNQKRSMKRLAEAEAEQATARVDEARAFLDSLEAGIAEAEKLLAQKQAMVNFERVELQRMERLASSGAVQQGVLDAARYKMKAAESDQQASVAKVNTAKAKLTGGIAAVRSAKADALATAAKVDVAQADIEYVQQLIRYSEIKAPWDGKVSARMFDAGAFIQSAEGNSGAKPLLTVVRDDRVRVTFSLSQNDIKHLKKGVQVTLSDIDALPGQKFEGTVTRFSGSLGAATRMMRVEMDLDNAKGTLRPGFFGYATVHFGP